MAAQDIRLVLQVTAKRVHQANAFMYRSLDLDTHRLDRFAGFVGDLLAGGNHMTRNEIRATLPAGWAEEKGFQMAYLMMYAELEGVVVSGPRRGNQLTYALLDERAAPTPTRSDEEALAEFVVRYLRTRGPATIPDLTTWSGLTVTQVKKALNLLGDEVTTVEQDGRAYLLVEDATPPAGTRSFLMPDYDEYGMAYKDRSALAHPDHDYWTLPWNRAVVIDGVIAGAWQRTLRPYGGHRRDLDDGPRGRRPARRARPPRSMRGSSAASSTSARLRSSGERLDGGPESGGTAVPRPPRRGRPGGSSRAVLDGRPDGVDVPARAASGRRRGRSR